MDDAMGFVSTPTAFSVSMDTKRRPTLPAALLSQVHIQPGDDLIAVPVGEGSILLQSREAALARTRESIRSGFANPVPEGAVDRFLQERRADHERDDASFTALHTTTPSDSDLASKNAAERGATLLTELGL